MTDIRVMREAFNAFVKELDEFLEGPFPNTYVYGEDIISVYVRKGTHCIGNTLFDCLDIATITVKEEFRGQGLGIRVIDHMHKINPYRITFVESLLNNGLKERLIKERWEEVPNAIPPCVYKFRPLKHGEQLWPRSSNVSTSSVVHS